CTLLLSYIIIRFTSSFFGDGKTKNLPPGPTRLPIIGNLHLLGDQPHRSLAKLAETHGPIMSLQLGQITTLVISSATAAKDVLQKQDLAFSTRHVPDAVHACDHARHAVAWLPVCTEWRTLRRILNSNIFSNNSLEANQHLRSQKVEELLAYCRKLTRMIMWTSEHVYFTPFGFVHESTWVMPGFKNADGFRQRGMHNVIMVGMCPPFKLQPIHCELGFFLFSHNPLLFQLVHHSKFIIIIKLHKQMDSINTKQYASQDQEQYDDISDTGRILLTSAPQEDKERLWAKVSAFKFLKVPNCFEGGRQCSSTNKRVRDELRRERREEGRRRQKKKVWVPTTVYGGVTAAVARTNRLSGDCGGWLVSLVVVKIDCCSAFAQHTYPIMELLILVSLLLFYIIIRFTSSIFGDGKTKNLPPGPTRLPIIGNLHLLGDQPHRSLAKLAETYGSIMSLQLGQITTLVISSATAAKDVLQKQDLAFSTRHVPDAVHACDHARHAVAWLPVCNEWRTLRRILNSNIFSNNSLEANQHLRSQKVEELLAYCRKASLSNDYVDIGRAAFRTSLNLLSNTIFSKDVTDPYEDSGKEFKEVITNIMVEAGKPNLVDFFPVLKKIDPQGKRRRLTRYFGKVLQLFEELIEERLTMGRLKQDDLLDVCLKIIQDSPNEINQTHIKSLFLDLFGAGTDTTSSTLEWAMAELLCNPKAMTKAKEELEEVIGKGKIVKENDVVRLPYLSCIVKETLRLHPPVPFLLPRKVVKEVQLNGYTILEGTQVLVNAWALGRDPTVWDDSLVFKPERFLESSRDVRGQDFDLIPFGAGRRICPGLPLAIRMISVMLGSLLNNFDWIADTKIQHDALDMTEKFGITLSKANPLCVVPIPLN
ncbi:hypothetical protein M8C21_014130, partial [Ambrosia artemisiifolia]